MARAKRHYLPGHVWHITHRCHKRDFLLKFPRDRRRWIEWLYQARKRKRIIDFERLIQLFGFEKYVELKDAHYKWVDGQLQTNSNKAESKWTQSIAVGSKTFVEKIKEALGFRARGRKIKGTDDTFELREGLAPYGMADKLESGNAFRWNLRHSP